MAEVDPHRRHESVLRSRKWRGNLDCAQGDICALGYPDAGRHPLAWSHAAAWRAWAADGDGWFLVPHAEILTRA